jgi:hypothetical protein
MGVAAYNRASACISKRIDYEFNRPVEFEIMDALNALQKHPDATAPFTPVRIGEGHGGWWIYCAKTGFGYWYKTLHEAVKRWDVQVVGYENREWCAIPAPV